MTVESRLKQLGWILPEPPKPVANYVPVVKAGGLLFTSGMLPLVDGRLEIVGKVGAALSIAQGQEAARIALLNLLAVIRRDLGDLDRIERIVRLTGHVQSAPGFSQQPAVLNAASDRLVELFGEAGRHTRLALGAAELPLNAPVELDLIAAFR